jgi:hypothetical protein
MHRKAAEIARKCEMCCVAVVGGRLAGPARTVSALSSLDRARRLLVRIMLRDDRKGGFVRWMTLGVSGGGLLSAADGNHCRPFLSCFKGADAQGSKLSTKLETIHKTKARRFIEIPLVLVGSWTAGVSSLRSWLTEELCDIQCQMPRRNVVQFCSQRYVTSSDDAQTTTITSHELRGLLVQPTTYKYCTSESSSGKQMNVLKGSDSKDEGLRQMHEPPTSPVFDELFQSVRSHFRTEVNCWKGTVFPM